MTATRRLEPIRNLPWAFVYSFIDRAALALLTVALAPVIGVHQTGLASLSMAIVFLALPVPQGISDAIVQLPKESERKFGILTLASTGLAILLALLIWSAAPAIATWLGDAELADLLRIHSLVVVAGGISAVPDGILARRLQFRMQAQRKVAGTVAGAAIAVAIALTWHSALSLLAFHLISQAVSAAIGVFTVRGSLWLERIDLNARELRRIAGSIASQFLGQLNLRAFDLIVGAMLTVVAVGLWRMGYNMMLLVTALTLAPAASLLLPAFSEDVRLGKNVAASFVAYHKYASTLAVPAFLATGAGLPFLFRDIFPAEWAGATLAGQIACLSGFANTISTLGLPTLLASGHYRELLSANLLSVLASVLLTIALVPFGIDAVAVSLLLKGVIVSGFIVYALRQRCGVSVRAIAGNFLMPTIAGGAASLVGYVAASMAPNPHLSLPTFVVVFIGTWATVMLFAFRQASRQVIRSIRIAVGAKRSPP